MMRTAGTFTERLCQMERLMSKGSVSNFIFIASVYEGRWPVLTLLPYPPINSLQSVQLSWLEDACGPNFCGLPVAYCNPCSVWFGSVWFEPWPVACLHVLASSTQFIKSIVYLSRVTSECVAEYQPSWIRQSLHAYNRFNAVISL